MKQNNENSVKIAVTGGIGSGKSTVCRLIRAAGYPVFSCDEESRRLWQDEEYLQKLAELFPEGTENGKIERKKLAKVVFHNAEKLKRLNDFSHPLIMERILKKMADEPISFAEVPLLFEGGFEHLFRQIVVVYRPLSDRIAAVCARDGVSVENVLSRIKNQVDYEKIIQNGHTVIYNDGDESALRQKVESFLANFNG